jgi:type IV pilus assembly protein PilQ
MISFRITKKIFSLFIAALFLSATLMVSANETRGLSTTLNFSFKEKKLQEILQVFSDSSGVNILPEEDIKDMKVTLKLENVTLEKALQELGRQYDLLITDSLDNVIHVTKLIKININIKNPITLDNILKLFERASDKDIIPSLEVLNDKRKLRLSIRNAPFKDALTTIVKSFDYVWFQDANGFIIVAPPARMKDEMITRVLKLNYRGVSDIAKESGEEKEEAGLAALDSKGGGAEKGSSQAIIIEILQTTVKSEFGKIVYDKDTNSIIITDLPEKIREMQKLLDQLDVRPTQLLISAKFVSIDIDNTTNFGLDWVNGISIGANGADIRNGIVFPFTAGKGGFEENIAVAAGPNAGATATDIYSLGSLSFSQTQLSLKLLKEYANGEVLQEPSITTLDNKQATIGVTKEIYYVEGSTVVTQASTNIQNEVKSKESGITLTIVAHATGRGEDVVVNARPSAKTFIKFTDLSGTLVPEIENRTVETNMIIKDGMTGVMGGLKFKSNNDIRRQLPVLGQIPGLGWLFKKKVNAHSDKELLIYITPKIVLDKNTDLLVKEINNLSNEISQNGLFPDNFAEKVEELPKSKFKDLKKEELPAD